MRIALPWPKLGIGAATSASRQDESLRRVAGRLAVQTVLLLLVMLVVLEIIVYAITQHALLGYLDKTLQTRAGQADPTVCHYYHLSCGGPGGAAPARGQGQAAHAGNHGTPGQGHVHPVGTGEQGPPPVFRPVSSTTDASATYVNRGLQIIHEDGNLGGHLLKPADAREAVRSRHVLCCSNQSYKGQNYRVYTAPLIVAGKVEGAVQTSIRLHQYQELMDSLVQSLLLVALLGVVGSAGISAALVNRALRPIRLAMQRQRDFVADAAHELRTPLAIQRTVAEVEMPEPSVDELQSTVAQMLGENRHLTRLVEDLSLLARADTEAISIEKRPVDLSGLLAQTAEEIGYLAADKGIVLDADLHDHVVVAGDVVRLRQLILILLDNSMKHTPEGGTIAVRLSPEGGRALLQVTDSGEGIAPADLPRVFDRFYRADQSRTGEGTGLGLAIAKWIVDAHGGHISAGNASPHGATFTVSLPLTRVPSPA